MVELAHIRIEYPKQDLVAITLDPSDTPAVDGEDEVQYRGSVEPGSADLCRSLHELPDLLCGNQTSLLRFDDYQLQLWTRPRDSTTVYLDIQATEDTRVSAPVSKLELCEQLISAAQSYHRLLCGDDRPPSVDRCDCATLAASAADMQRRLTYYQEHGTLRGYTPSVAEHHLAAFAADCVYSDRLRELVVESGDLPPFVQQLTENGDDAFVTSCYDNLLEHFEELIRPTTEVLAQHPDERAKNALQAVLWSDFEENILLMTVKALQQIPDASVIEQMASLLELHSTNHVELCLTIAEWFQTLDLTVHLDDSELEQIQSELRSALESTDRQELEEELEEALATFPAGR